MDQPIDVNKFRVAPGQNLISDRELANFNQVLVIVKSENGVITAEWAPIIFAKLEANRRTLKIVNGKDLAGLEIHNRLGCYDISNDVNNGNILISDTFLDAQQVAALIDLLNENDNFYNDLYEQALALHIAGDINVDNYRQFIVKICARLDRLNRAYAAANYEQKKENREQREKRIEEEESQLKRERERRKELKSIG